MTLIDYGVATVMLISILLAVYRGGVSELLSLAAWLAAFALAWVYTGAMAQWLPPTIPTLELRLFIAFLLIFLLVWLAATLLKHICARMIEATGLSPVDRVLGMFFGGVRGLLIIACGVLLAGLTTLPQQAVWRNALSYPYLQTLAQRMHPWLPEPLAARMRYR